MPSRLSEVFAVPQQRWEKTGAFDAFIGMDARLHIDPFLLGSSSAIELADAKPTFDTHFLNIVRLLSHSRSYSDPFFAEAVKRLTFKEIPNTGLGYSKKGRKGSGIGAGLATEIAKLGKLIIDAGVADPEIFSLMGLLQDDIGSDRISDMTAAIILENLLAFTDRVVSDLGISCVEIRRKDKCFKIPVDPSSNDRFVLVPIDILRDLPVAFSWQDIDIVCAHNRELRDRVNSLIGESWKDVNRLSKPQLRDILLSNPDLIRDLLNQYKRKEARSYDLRSDPKMLYSWQPVTRQVAAQNPLLLSLGTESSNSDLIELVRVILTKFKSLIESNRLYRLLYNDNGTPRREKAAQLALFGIADAYCEANNLDISPEADSGNGPVDFKFSRGYNCKILAEVKLSSNSKLVLISNKAPQASERPASQLPCWYICTD